MRRRSPWVTIMVGLAACVTSTVSERDVDAARRTDFECATSQGTESCAEGALSEEAGQTPSSHAGGAVPWETGPTLGSDARVASPPEGGLSPSFPGFGGLPEAGLFPISDAGVGSPRGEGGCEYLSQHFENGVTFLANDGCNRCECFHGSAGCTLVGCLGRPAHCDLPFDPGPCDESHSYYAHNPSTGLCEAKQYSGCGGNLNRFSDYLSCAARCSLREGTGRDCSHEGRSYRHRERVVRKPSEMTGCGPCLCNDGRVLCPPPGCECPDGHKLGLQCVGCWAAGGCSDIEEQCYPACDADADCDTAHGLVCDTAQGVCVSTFSCP